MVLSVTSIMYSLVFVFDDILTEENVFSQALLMFEARHKRSRLVELARKRIWSWLGGETLQTGKKKSVIE